MRRDRFQTLIDHCRTKPGHVQFDFNLIGERNACGTVGCLMGEMAYCWPDDFQLLCLGEGDAKPSCAGALILSREDHPLVASCEFKRWYTHTENSVALAAAWFEIDYETASWLFLPYEEHEALGKNNLSADSTLAEVLANLEQFISHTAPEPV